MANLLYRLGRFSARRAWLVVIGWVLALGLAGGAFVAFGGALATSFSIPGTETTRVTDEIADELGGAAGANGTVVFQSEDGEAFTDAQRAEITELLESVTDLEGVNQVVDPFATEQQLADQRSQLEDGAAQLDAGRAQLDASRTELEAGQAQLDAGRAQLEAALEQASQAGPAAAAQVQAQLDGLAPQQAQLDEGLAQLEAGEAELEASATQLDDGQRLLDASSGIRTVSEDGATAMGSIVFEDDQFSMPAEVKTGVVDALEAASIDGVTIDWDSTLAQSVEGLVGPGEVIGVIVALLVLIIMLRVLLPALMPLIASIIGVGVGVVGSLAFSGVVDMSSVTPALGGMVGLAVGIDYSLFILHRHRRQLLQGMEAHESIGLANGTAGNAVVFAGSTVVVALLALNITGIGFLGVMGTVGAVCVLVAVIVAVTLTPALLGLLGLRLLPKKQRARVGHHSHAQTEPKPMRTGSAVVRVLVGAIALLIVAIPALDMRLGLPDGSTEAQDTTQYRSYAAIEEAFGAGQSGPIVVTASLADTVGEDELVGAQADLASFLMDQEHVTAVAPAAASDDRGFLLFQVIPDDGPSSVSTEELVHGLRDLSPVDVDGLGTVELGVAGQASANIDVSEKLADVLPVYLAVVVGLSLLIMILVFRSLLVPLIATGGYVLSLVAAFGGMVAVYQWGWLGPVFGVETTGPLLSFAPIIIMGVLFGLAMDYQLFLVSGMREAYTHGLPARHAVTAGFRNGRAVVTAAAIIMVSVFGGFVFSHMAMIRPLGFGLAFGVLFDAFVVRMLIVPGLMHLFGKSAWYLPRWLDRILPDVDVEGAALERKHPVAH
ncbi:MAG: MMPL family transporter [Microbacteriaceae bacterium]